MKKMMKNRKGFTLMEMLIVVAIIAILVIIAIPTFNSALAKARAATDVANIRSGYAAALVEAMTDGIKGAGAGKDSVEYYLQNDGTVAAKGTNDYTCVGAAENAGATDSTLVGGVVKAKEISWEKGDKIKYTVKENKDGTISVAISKVGGNAGQTTNP